MSMYHVCVVPMEGREHPLELGLQMVLNYQVGTGNLTRVLYKLLTTEASLQALSFYFINLLLLCVQFVYMYTLVPGHECGGQRTAFVELILSAFV